MPCGMQSINLDKGGSAVDAAKHLKRSFVGTLMAVLIALCAITPHLVVWYPVRGLLYHISCRNAANFLGVLNSDDFMV